MLDFFILSSGSVLGFLILNGADLLLFFNGSRIGVGIRLGIKIGVSSGVEIVGNDTFGVGSSLVLIVVKTGGNGICVLIVVIIGDNGIRVLIVVPGAGGGGPRGPGAGGSINPAGLFTPPAKLSLISFNNFITPSS